MKNNYKYIAYALAGYSKERRQEFKEIYKDLYPQMDNAYLQAAMAFLCLDYAFILKEPKLSLGDRIAFACIYFTDEELQNHIRKLRDAAIQRGDLHGILLTGLTREGVFLMQRYVDRTADVQTVCIQSCFSYY